MHALHALFLVSEPDRSHGEEEGSGHMPTFELSSQNAIMCGNLQSAVIQRIRSQSTYSLLSLTFVRHSRIMRYGTAFGRV